MGEVLEWVVLGVAALATVFIALEMRALRRDLGAFRAEVREASFAWYSDHSESSIRPYGHDILQALEVIADNLGNHDPVSASGASTED